MKNVQGIVDAYNRFLNAERILLAELSPDLFIGDSGYAIPISHKDYALLKPLFYGKTELKVELGQDHTVTFTKVLFSHRHFTINGKEYIVGPAFKEDAFNLHNVIEYLASNEEEE